MKENVNMIANLIYKKIKGIATSDELNELNNWAAKSPGNQMWLDKVGDKQYLDNAIKIIESADSESIRRRFMKKISRSSLRRT